MAIKTVAEFKVGRLEILEPDGTVGKGLKVDFPDDTLLKMYRKMVEVRIFDEKAVALHRQGKLVNYPSLMGQEATQVVPPMLIQPKDWMVPTYRGHGAYYIRGLKFRYILLYWAGDERGFKLPEGTNDMIFSFPAGTHLSQAAGLAWAEKLRKEESVVLAYLGDGATAKGDFHESMTIATNFRLPVIYLVENNHWWQTSKRNVSGQTIAQKAFAYGAQGLQVDGNDPMAVHHAVNVAVERARKGGGPTVADCQIFRPGADSKNEQGPVGIPPEALEEWKAKDPIARLRKHLESKGLWDQDKETRLRIEAEILVKYEIEECEGALAPNPLNIFSDNFASPPWHLREQRQVLEDLLKRKLSPKEFDELPPVEGRFPDA